MSDKDKILVLGAGASVPYGLPTGPGLKKFICANLAEPSDGTSLPLTARIFVKRLMDLGFGRNLLNEFCADFHASPRQSIDLFMRNREKYREVGRAAIAAAIIQYESRQRLFGGPDGDWYGWLYNHIGKSLEDFRRNPFVILTFNYDRSVETYFYTAMRDEFNLAEEASRELLPIIHMHGSVGDHAYGESLDAIDLAKCADGLRLIGEIDTAKNESFEKARRFIWNAKRILFLGCAYHPENIENLGISNDWPPNSIGRRLGHEPPPQKAVYGTTYQLNPAEIDSAASLFQVAKHLRREDSGRDTLDYLRTYGC